MTPQSGNGNALSATSGVPYALASWKKAGHKKRRLEFWASPSRASRTSCAASSTCSARIRSLPWRAGPASSSSSNTRSNPNNRARRSLRPAGSNSSGVTPAPRVSRKLPPTGIQIDYILTTGPRPCGDEATPEGGPEGPSIPPWREGGNGKVLGGRILAAALPNRKAGLHLSWTRFRA